MCIQVSVRRSALRVHLSQPLPRHRTEQPAACSIAVGTPRGHGFYPISALAQLAEPRPQRGLKLQCSCFRSNSRVEPVCAETGSERRSLCRAGAGGSERRGATAGSRGTCTRKECTVTLATARPSVICLAVRRRRSERRAKSEERRAKSEERRAKSGDSLSCVDIASISRRAIR
jgi:hypothetical protein